MKRIGLILAMLVVVASWLASSASAQTVYVHTYRCTSVCYSSPSIIHEYEWSASGHHWYLARSIASSGNSTIWADNYTSAYLDAAICFNGHYFRGTTSPWATGSGGAVSAYVWMHDTGARC